MAVSIECPQCHCVLKLKDRSLLGRKGKCAKCGHTFILSESIPESAKPPLPVSEPSNPFASLTEAVPQPPQSVPREFTFGGVGNREESSAGPSVFSEISIDSGPTSDLKELRKRNAKRNHFPLIASGVIVGLVVAGVIIAVQFSGTKESKLVKQPVAEQKVESPSLPEPDGEELFDPAETEYARLGRPTQGKPIELRWIPFGSQVILQLHPAKIWDSGDPERLSLCVPPLAKLMETAVSDLFSTSPEAIDELLITLIPGIRGSAPDVAAVARMTDERAVQKLTAKLGSPVTSYDQPIFVDHGHSYLVVDSRTIAVCPEKLTDEMIAAADQPHPAEPFDSLLPMTDSDRLFTVLFTPKTLMLHDTWVAGDVSPLVSRVIDELSDETESACCSVHRSNELFHSEILLREKRGSIKKFEQQIRRKLETLAGTLLPAIEKMNPQGPGERQLIGRLPAMIEVFSMATVVDRGSHHVRLVTPLPSRAGPNLFLASYLAWDESTRTDFSQSVPIATTSSRPATSVAERLKKKIDVDFRGTPFSEAFDIIGGEISTPVEIDGDALKAGGFTKNLKQTIRLDAVAVYDVILRIFQESKSVEGNPEKQLVLVVDESNQKLIVTTFAAADKKGWQPFLSNP